MHYDITVIFRYMCTHAVVIYVGIVGLQIHNWLFLVLTLLMDYGLLILTQLVIVYYNHCAFI